MFIEALKFWSISKIEAGHQSACINSEGELFLWGRGVFGEYPYPQKILTISNRVCDVSLGNTIGIAIDDKGIAWSWGSNTNGELGVGDRDPRIHPFPILNLKGKTVTQAFCGDQFVISLGNTVRKEIPGLNFSQHGQEVLKRKQKKKAKKRPKNADIKH